MERLEKVRNMMTCESLEQAMEQLSEKQWACLSHFFSEKELSQLKASAQTAWNQGQFAPAKVGRSAEQQRAQSIRSDSTLWLDLSDPNYAFLSHKIQALQSTLNQNFFLGLKEFECHFAHYSPGQFYDEHIDQARLQSPLHGERVISFVLYLNSNWSPEDGGQLSIRSQTPFVEIDPVEGRLVLFRSDTVPHAVRPATRERWSLTGWFRRF